MGDAQRSVNSRFRELSGALREPGMLGEKDQKTSKCRSWIGIVWSSTARWGGRDGGEAGPVWSWEAA